MNYQPGRELDKLVAEKVLGLQVCKCDHQALRQKAYDDYVERCKDPMAYHGTPAYFSHGSDKNCNHCGKAYIPVRNYSTNIAAAWTVVDKAFNNDWILYKGLRGYQVYAGSREFEDGRELASAETVAHAICLAALKVVQA